MVEITKDAQEAHSMILTLLLSWQIARYMGKNQAASIKKTARKLKSQTKDPAVFDMFRKIAVATSEKQVIVTIEKCFKGWQELGLIK